MNLLKMIDTRTLCGGSVWDKLETNRKIEYLEKSKKILQNSYKNKDLSDEQVHELIGVGCRINKALESLKRRKEKEESV